VRIEPAQHAEATEPRRGEGDHVAHGWEIACVNGDGA
jgi:hypothetical protein